MPIGRVNKRRGLMLCATVLGMYGVFIATTSVERDVSMPKHRSTANMLPLEHEGVLQVNKMRKYNIVSMHGNTERPNIIQEKAKSNNTFREVEDFMTQQTEVQNHRKQTMTNVCKRNPQLGHGNISPDTLRHIYVCESTHMLYCFVPKVGCSNWKRVMMVIGGYPKPLNDITSDEAHLRNGMTRLAGYKPMERQQILKSYKKFMFARNPFARILSAYRNKFENIRRYKTGIYFHSFGKRIMKKYRHNATQSDLRTGEGIMWNEFAQYIADPTQYSGFDDHWEEIYRLCSPCKVTYDYIGTLETITDDAAYILKSMKVDDKVTYPGKANSHPTNSSAQFDSYYGQLDRNILQRMWNIYRLDFELFGYKKPHILL